MIIAITVAVYLLVVMGIYFVVDSIFWKYKNYILNREIFKSEEKMGKETEELKKEIDRYTQSVQQNTDYLLNRNNILDLKVGQMFTLQMQSGVKVNMPFGVRKSELMVGVANAGLSKKDAEMVWNEYCNIVKNALKDKK